MQTSKKEFEVSATVPTGGRRLFDKGVRCRPGGWTIEGQRMEGGYDKQFWGDPQG